MRTIEILEGGIENPIHSFTDIAHQANCQCKMGSGVAKALVEKFPLIASADVHFALKGATRLGHVSLCDDYAKVGPHPRIWNLYGQEYYGYDAGTPRNGSFPLMVRYTSYDALFDALTRLRWQINELRSSTAGPIRLAFPYCLGSDRGGGDWNVVGAMIRSIFDREPYDIFFVKP